MFNILHVEQMVYDVTDKLMFNNILFYRQSDSTGIQMQ